MGRCSFKFYEVNKRQLNTIESIDTAIRDLLKNNQLKEWDELEQRRTEFSNEAVRKQQEKRYILRQYKQFYIALKSCIEKPEHSEAAIQNYFSSNSIKGPYHAVGLKEYDYIPPSPTGKKVAAGILIGSVCMIVGSALAMIFCPSPITFAIGIGTILVAVLAMACAGAYLEMAGHYDDKRIKGEESLIFNEASRLVLIKGETAANEELPLEGDNSSKMKIR